MSLKKIYMNFDLKHNDLAAVTLHLKVYVTLYDLLASWKLEIQQHGEMDTNTYISWNTQHN